MPYYIRGWGDRGLNTYIAMLLVVLMVLFIPPLSNLGRVCCDIFKTARYGRAPIYTVGGFLTSRHSAPFASMAATAEFEMRAPFAIHDYEPVSIQAMVARLKLPNAFSAAAAAVPSKLLFNDFGELV